MTTEPEFPIAPAETLFGVLGFEHPEMGEERCVGRFTVARRHMQAFGIVHGGTYAALAEGLVSEATVRAVGPQGFIANGMSHNLNFLRPVTEGTVTAVGTRRHRGRTTWVWDVDMSDEQDRLCATARITIAIRPMPDELKAQLGVSA